uniref:Uncharacterized protein llpP n=1 Tax=Streptomyces tendae TaxID=1932 RepID=A7DWH8_STRTE|nr:hypothetical protein [Streptomyces tendae]
MHALGVRRILTAAGAALSLVYGTSAAAGAVTGSGTTAKTATTYYVDCRAGKDTNAGTSSAAPWRTLRKVGSKTFRPGDVIAFRKGTTCKGTLTPHGSGTARRPISITSYGTGARPKLVADDARAVIYLRNVQGWEIRNLDISDPGTNTTDPRTGIYVELSDFGAGSHYVFSNNYIHDVGGCDCTNPGQPGGGIVLNATGSKTVSSVSDVKITNNTLRTVNGMGIGTSSLWQRRAEYPSGPGTAYGADYGIVVQGNVLSDLGGDGINITNGQHALLQHNTVEGFGLRATIDHAGIWAWNSDYTTIQHNTIGGGDAGALGAFAFDVDGASTGTLYQYNFSHDNSGLMLICALPGLPSDRPTIRYNVSQNDRDASGGVVILACGRQTNISIYGNDVYAPTAKTMWVNDSDGDTPAVTNNIFVGRPGGSAFKDTLGTFDSNLYRHITSPPSDRHAVLGDPGFVSPGTATSVVDAAGYRLKKGAPALGAGAAMRTDARRDFYGNPIPAWRANIGAYQGSGVS